DAWRATLSPRQLALIQRELREAPAMLGYPALEASTPSAIGPRSPLEFATAGLQTARQRLRHRSRIRAAMRGT
ncbi:MAG TPA: hypothetical protein VFS60_15870, partial [Thermoanaerobaculia bacterium]|nr:hypothetical protein [Thermoanaerobaculia bacterium]